MIFVIDDDRIMANCIARATGLAQAEIRIFGNAIEAVSSLDGELPKMILMDVMLTGPDGFTLLNELASYSDTAKIPVVIISALDFCREDLEEYGVVGVLNKEKMVPEEIRKYVAEYAK